MISKLSNWFKKLEKSGKIAVIGGAALSVLAIASASADNNVVITTRNETKTVAIPYETTYQDDDNLLTSDVSVITPGTAGSKQIRYKITYRNGKESKRETEGETVTKQPIQQISKRGTKEIVMTDVVEAVPFGANTVQDASMDKGMSAVTTPGVNGSKLVTFEVTKVRGQEISRRAVKETVTVQPVTQITSVGAKAKSACDPNYSGACVPIASDVDCGNGSGNGPAYVYGTVRVVGSDVYGLDRDGDGYGCD